MKHKHAFVHFIITLMFTLPIVVQAEPPSNNPLVLDARVTALEALIVAQQQEIDNLTSRLACVSDASTSTEVIFEGCNVHVRNAAGQTDSVNGLGNLIVGYNEDSFRINDRTGSHNLVVGPEHTYSSYGGFVAGFWNSVTGAYASVSGGSRNTASGLDASVSGGHGNTASGDDASVSGGEVNTASGERSSVSGGAGNTASSSSTSVSGGVSNTASGVSSSILGGISQNATTLYETIPALP